MSEDIVQHRISREVSDAGPRLRNTTTALLVLAFVFVALRLAARVKRGLNYGADDWMIVVSLVSAYVSALDNLPWAYLEYSLFASLPEDLTMPVSLYLLRSIRLSNISSDPLGDGKACYYSASRQHHRGAKGKSLKPTKLRGIELY
jgi:hypothetical protein